MIAEKVELSSVLVIRGRKSVKVKRDRIFLLILPTVVELDLRQCIPSISKIREALGMEAHRIADFKTPVIDEKFR